MSSTPSETTEPNPLSTRQRFTGADLLTIIFVLAALAFLASLFALRSDFYWLLAAGRSLALDGWTDLDPFLTWNQGQQWLNQQWLFELLLYKAYSLFGLKTVAALYALVLAATLTLAASMPRNIKLGLVGALLTAGSLVAVWDIRAAGVGILLFTLVLFLSLDPSPKRGLATVAVFVLWANLHGSVVIGLAFLTLLLTFRSLEAGRLAKQYLWLLLAAVLASLLSPLGIDTVVYAAQLGTNPALPHLTSEWRSAFARPLALGYLAVYLVAVIVVMRRQSLRYLILLVPFVAITLIASRNLVFLGPLACYLFALNNRPPTKLKFSRLGLSVAALLTVAFVFLAINRPEPQPTAHLCTELINQLPDQVSGRLAVSTGQGSYLLWRRPDLPITVDGRLEVYTASQLLNNRKITNAWPGTSQRLRSYRINNILVYSPFAIPRLQRLGFRSQQYAGRCWLMVRG